MRDTNDLEPLFSALKVANIGEYIYSKDFQCFAIQSNIDGAWTYYKKKVTERSGTENTADYEVAFFMIMSRWYEDEYFEFHEFILPILLNFAKWKSIRVDLHKVSAALLMMKIPDDKISGFIDELLKIQKDKPLKLEYK